MACLNIFCSVREIHNIYAIAIQQTPDVKPAGLIQIQAKM